jgi:hypothetical protein
MHTLSAAYRLALLLLLLAGCRSEKVTFPFRAAQPLVVRVDTTQLSRLVAPNTTTKAIPRVLSSSEPVKQGTFFQSKSASLYRVIEQPAQRVLSHKAGTREIAAGIILHKRIPASGVLEIKESASLGEIVFTIGGLLIIAGIVAGILAGFNVGVIFIAVGVLMAGAAYGGIK